MWTRHNLNQWQRLARHIMTIDSGNEGEGGNGDGNATGGDNHDDGDENGSDEDRSKDFSRALAKRTAEIEKKYADKYKDYDELKKKAEELDKQKEEGKSDMDRLSERLAAIEAERDKLESEKKRSETIEKVAKASGLSVDVIRLLAGDDEEKLTEAAKVLNEQIAKNSKGGKIPPAARDDKRVPDADRHGMDLLRDAYSK